MTITKYILIWISILEYISSREEIEIANYTYPKREEDPQDIYTICILHTNDIHGTYFPTRIETPKGGVYERGGLEYLGKYISILRDEWKDRFLYLDGGDQFQGGLESKMTNGSIITEFLNTMKVNMTALGNHEWDFGQDFLKERMHSSEFKYAIANMEDEQGNPIVFGDNQVLTATVQVGKVKVGIIGITTILTVETTSGDLSGMRFLDYPTIITKHASALRKEANCVILLAHVGLKCLKDGDAKLDIKIRDKTTPQKECNQADEIYQLLRKLPKGTVDAVLAAHKHDVTHHWVYETPVMSNDRNGQFASVMYLNFDVKNNYQLIKDKIQFESPLPVCSKVFTNTKRCEIPANATIETQYGDLIEFSFHGISMEKEPLLADITEKYKDEHDKALKDVLTSTNELFYQAKTGEAALGNLYCDYYRKITGSDVCIVNSGAFRTQWTPGNVSYASLYSMFPFENRVVSFYITGVELKRMINEAQTGVYSFYPTSGLKQVVYQKGTMKKVLSVTLFDGYEEKQIEDTTLYKVSTNDFCVPLKEGVKGGDDFRKITEWMKPRNKKDEGEPRDLMKKFLLTYPQLKTSYFIDSDNPRLRVIKVE